METPNNSDRKALFGGERPWNRADWTPSDDRVRGGASTSFLDAHASNPIAIFLGHLDISVLGGAGFASQRTTATEAADLSGYDGIELDLAGGDGKRYTLVVKDEVLPRRGDGREQSSVSWEYDFVGVEEGGKVWVAWGDLRATYRGREKSDAVPLRTDRIMRMSLMMRSFFGEQEGNFQLRIKGIAAVRKEAGKVAEVDGRSSVETVDEKDRMPVPAKKSWLLWFMGGCARL